jgi:RimJ/RimL family protein N-acetyltransferase
MTILYLARLSSGDEPPALRSGFHLRIWRPHDDGLPPARRGFWGNIFWWLLDRCGLFANAEFREITIWRRRRLMHRLIVTPRWRRFPFMAAHDLQIGALWTAPSARGRGLAQTAILHALRHGHRPEQRIWYVVDAANERSVRLAERCGFIAVGQGRRTAPAGLRILGSFRVDQFF